MIPSRMRGIVITGSASSPTTTSVIQFRGSLRAGCVTNCSPSPKTNPSQAVRMRESSNPMKPSTSDGNRPRTSADRRRSIPTSITTAKVPGIVIDPKTRTEKGSGRPIDCRSVPIIQMRSHGGMTTNCTTPYRAAGAIPQASVRMKARFMSG